MSKTISLFFGFFFSVWLYAEIVEPMPGARNPRINGGDPYAFKCDSPNVSLTSDGTIKIAKPIFKTKKNPGKKEWRLPGLSGSEPLTYAECFLVKDHLVLAYEATKGGEGACFIANFDLVKGQKDWVRQFPCLNLGVPLVESGFLYVGGAGSFIKVSLKDGNAAWSQKISCTSYVSPEIEDNAVSFGCRLTGYKGHETETQIKLDNQTGQILK